MSDSDQELRFQIMVQHMHRLRRQGLCTDSQQHIILNIYIDVESMENSTERENKFIELLFQALDPPKARELIHEIKRMMQSIDNDILQLKAKTSDRSDTISFNIINSTLNSNSYNQEVYVGMEIDNDENTYKTVTSSSSATMKTNNESRTQHQIKKEESNYYENLSETDIQTLLIRLKGFAFIGQFVDLQQYPNYNAVIANPMDLTIITKKLEDGEYHDNSIQFINDIELLWTNCFIYFSEPNIIEAAKYCQIYFNKELKNHQNCNDTTVTTNASSSSNGQSIIVIDLLSDSDIEDDDEDENDNGPRPPDQPKDQQNKDNKNEDNNDEENNDEQEDEDEDIDEDDMDLDTDDELQGFITVTITILDFPCLIVPPPADSLDDGSLSVPTKHRPSNQRFLNTDRFATFDDINNDSDVDCDAQSSISDNSSYNIHENNENMDNEDDENEVDEINNNERSFSFLNRNISSSQPLIDGEQVHSSSNINNNNVISSSSNRIIRNTHRHSRRHASYVSDDESDDDDDDSDIEKSDRDSDIETETEMDENLQTFRISKTVRTHTDDTGSISSLTVSIAKNTRKRNRNADDDNDNDNNDNDDNVGNSEEYDAKKKKKK